MRTITILVFSLLVSVVSNAQLYEKIYDGANFKAAQDVVPKSNGNNLVLFTGSGTSAYSTIAEINMNGDTLWTKQIQLNTGTYFTHIHIRTDQKIVVAGSKRWNGTSTLTVARLSATGILEDYTSFANGAIGDPFTINDFLVDSNDNIYLASSYVDVGVDAFGIPILMKLAPDFTVLWIRKYGNHNASNELAGKILRLAQDSQGFIYTWGYRSRDGIANFQTSYLGKWTPSGDVVWSREVLKSAAVLYTGLAVDDMDNIYAMTHVYSTESTFGGDDFEIHKFSANGDTLWNKAYGTVLDEQSMDLVFSDGRLYVGGRWDDNIEHDLLLTTIDTSGIVISSNRHGEPGTTEICNRVNRTNNGQLMTLSRVGGNKAHIMQFAGDGITACKIDTVILGVQSIPSNMTSGVVQSNATATEIPSSTHQYTYSGYTLNTTCSAAAPCATEYNSVVDSICNGQTYIFGTQNLTTAGIYVDTFPNALSCDSVVTLNLIVNVSDSGSETITECDSYTWPANGTTYTSSGTYSATLSNAAGCDSIATLNLTINYSNSGSESINECDSYTWPANSTTYTSSGTYSATLTNAAGCDSIASLNLTINSSSSSSETITECVSYTWPANGTTYTSSGTYSATLTNAAGCDSIASLNLTINNSNSGSETISACDNYTWPANSTTYTSSGTYSATLTNTFGCDSIATLNLTINNSNSGSETITECDSYTWPANNTTYTSSGTYSVTLTNTFGCDSIATLNLTINNSNSGSETISACDSYTWPANSTTYTSSGAYSATLTNAAGCDSIATLNLTINNSNSGSETITECDSYTWPANGTTYTSSGTYSATLTNSFGCDSVATLFLDIETVNSSVSQAGATLTADELGASYQWFTCPGMTPLSGATNQSYTAISNGDYAVIVSSNNCSDTSSCYSVTGIGIAENELAATVQIYPNPTTGDFVVNLGESYRSVKVTITDLRGRVIQSNQYSLTQLLSLNIDEPTGLYILILEVEDEAGSAAVTRILELAKQ